VSKTHSAAPYTQSQSATTAAAAFRYIESIRLRRDPIIALRKMLSDLRMPGINVIQ
jgi:hypothetical protein